MVRRYRAGAAQLSFMVALAISLVVLPASPRADSAPVSQESLDGTVTLNDQGNLFLAMGDALHPIDPPAVSIDLLTSLRVGNPTGSRVPGTVTTDGELVAGQAGALWWLSPSDRKWVDPAALASSDALQALPIGDPIDLSGAEDRARGRLSATGAAVPSATPTPSGPPTIFSYSGADWKKFSPRQTSDYERALGDGTLVTHVHKANTIFTERLGPIVTGDVLFEASARQIDGPSGSWGVAVRGSDGYVTLLIDPTHGTYRVQRYSVSTTTWKTLIASTASAAIHRGREVNQAAVWARGQKLTVAINRQAIADVTDPGYAPGALELATDASAEGNTGVEWLTATAWDNATAPQILSAGAGAPVATWTPAPASTARPTTAGGDGGPPWPVPVTRSGAELAPIAGYLSFSTSNVSDWSMDGGSLVVKLLRAGFFTWKRVATTGSAYGVELTAHQLSDVPDNQVGGAYGILIGESDVVRYAFLINTQYQTWVMDSYYEPTRTWANKRWQKNTAIKRGTNTNVLRADYVHGELGFTINGQAVGTQKPDGFAPGSVGIGVEAFDLDGYRVAIDRFVAFAQSE